MFDLKWHKKPRVLIVDDDAEVCETLRERLEFNNLEIITASNGQEGLAAVITHKPDIIITDISMPVMDGLEMAKAIRDAGLDKNIPIIIISANKRTEDLSAAKMLQVEEYLTKPFEMSELLGTIENLLELSTVNASLH